MVNGENLERILFSPQRTLREAMEVMTGPPGSPIILVVDPDRYLLGILVDYDIRKALLAGKTLDSSVREAMNPHPVWLPNTTDRKFLDTFFHKQARKAVPLLDESGRVHGVALASKFLTVQEKHDNWVLIMAGGFGTRLKPLTNNLPKPMARVGDTPIMETIIRQFLDFGFDRFMISVHYRAAQIKDYFKDGAAWGATVEYLEEKTPLGTAGALSLIPHELTDSLIVMNGDLLTRANMRSLLDFHVSNGNQATMCVREHYIEVPFGVVEVDGLRMKDMVEKPIYRTLVNAGIYVLEPDVVGMVPPGRKMDMPQLLTQVKTEFGGHIGCFPISEYWMDIGCPQSHQKAMQEFKEVFHKG